MMAARKRDGGGGVAAPRRRKTIGLLDVGPLASTDDQGRHRKIIRRNRTNSLADARAGRGATAACRWRPGCRPRRKEALPRGPSPAPSPEADRGAAPVQPRLTASATTPQTDSNVKATSNRGDAPGHEVLRRSRTNARVTAGSAAVP